MKRGMIIGVIGVVVIVLGVLNWQGLTSLLFDLPNEGRVWVTDATTSTVERKTPSPVAKALAQPAQSEEEAAANAQADTPANSTIKRSKSEEFALRLKGDKSETAAADIIAKASVRVLEKAPEKLLAKTLAEASDDALSKVDPKTLAEISDSLSTMAGATSEPLPAAPIPLPTDNQAVAIALPMPVAPTPLPTGNQAEVTALPTLTVPESIKLTAAPADPRKLILEAPAELLAAVPKKLLARALAEVPTKALASALDDELKESLPKAIAHAEAEIKLDDEAHQFIAQLTQPAPEPIAVSKANHFVQPNQPLNLTKLLPSAQSAQALLDQGVDLDQKVTAIRISHKLEPLHPKNLIADAGGDMAQAVRILEREKVVEIPLAVALERHRLWPDKPITVVRAVEYAEPTTLRELQAAAQESGGALPRVVPGDYGVDFKTVQQLLGLHTASDPNSIYYIRTVQPGDVQGIWGIIQAGLIDNFARGMAIRRGEELSTYRVHIPRLADEPLDDETGRSSFLGQMIYHKMHRSMLYNIKLGRIATRPEEIQPGQQIVIVSFSPNELVSIYRHFVGATKKSS